MNEDEFRKEVFERLTRIETLLEAHLGETVRETARVRWFWPLVGTLFGLLISSVALAHTLLK
jgi:cobalamin synthase